MEQVGKEVKLTLGVLFHGGSLAFSSTRLVNFRLQKIHIQNKEKYKWQKSHLREILATHAEIFQQSDRPHQIFVW